MKVINDLPYGLDNLINEIQSEFAKESILFRGQYDFDFKLIPGIFREEHRKVDESALIAEFKRRNPTQRDKHKTELEWLTLMQHYDFPTRLLDWSSNLLVALYFCCKDAEKDGALYCIDSSKRHMSTNNDKLIDLALSKSGLDFVHKLIQGRKNNEHNVVGVNYLSLEDETYGARRWYQVGHDIEQGKINLGVKNPVGDIEYHDGGVVLAGTYFKITPHLNERIIKQHGAFTLHGGKTWNGSEAIKHIPLDDYCNSGLVKIKIPENFKKRYLRDLSLLGINQSSMYPEMEYQKNNIIKMCSQ